MARAYYDIARAYVYFVDKNEWMGGWRVDLEAKDFDKAGSKPNEKLYDVQTLKIAGQIIRIAGNEHGWRLVQSLLHHQANAPSGRTFHPARNLFNTTADLARALSKHEHIYFHNDGITISALGAQLGAALGDDRFQQSATFQQILGVIERVMRKQGKTKQMILRFQRDECDENNCVIPIWNNMMISCDIGKPTMVHVVASDGSYNLYKTIEQFENFVGEPVSVRMHSQLSLSARLDDLERLVFGAGLE